MPTVRAATAGAVVFFRFGSPWLWVGAFLPATTSAPAAAAFGVFGPELFPTRIRSTANNFVVLVGVAGSAAGLLAAGQLSSRIGIGHAVALLGVCPLVAAAIIGVLFPETARKELEITSREPTDFP